MSAAEPLVMLVAPVTVSCAENALTRSEDLA